jgi:branched-chain amino acid transport system ATP-binding protein
MTDDAGILLEIEDLTAGYGAAQILFDINLKMGVEAVAVIGRNGMGKTTLCKTLTGLIAATGGSVKLRGQELVGLKTHRVANHGIGYVPQGRRLFPSLTVDEHLRMLAKGTKGQRWTPDTVYDLFPRLTERRKVSGGSLSGGEQQMLAIGRALLLNAPLIIMDEPSEGLAPTIVEDLIGTCKSLVGEGHAVLLVEQNLAVATEVADRQLIMVSGRIETEMRSEDLINDADAQRRYLGVDSLEDDAA